MLAAAFPVQVPDLDSDGGVRDGLAIGGTGFAVARGGVRLFSVAALGFGLAAAEAGATGFVGLAAGGSVETAAAEGGGAFNDGAVGCGLIAGVTAVASSGLLSGVSAGDGPAVPAAVASLAGLVRGRSNDRVSGAASGSGPTTAGAGRSTMIEPGVS